MYSAHPFVFPSSLSFFQRVDFCLRIIDKYKAELPYLRKQLTISKRQKDQTIKEREYWKKRYQEEKEKSGKLKQENDQLTLILEKLLKTNLRYQVALFDHGNFKTKLEGEKKTKGGQIGHQDTNRETLLNSKNYEHLRVFTKNCSSCGTVLPRVESVKEKTLIDIILNPQALRLVVQAERQWCPKCRKEVLARHGQSIPFTEYGLNTFMVVILLRFASGLTLSKVGTVMTMGFGLSLSKSEVASLLAQAKTYLGGKYEALKEAARKNKITYTDETGWQVHGRGAWMWITATEKETVYFAAESRGKGIAKELYGNSSAYSMHDGLASYESAIPKEKHLYCWAHLLRFAFEETINSRKNSDSIKLRERLVEIYHFKKDHPEWTEWPKKNFQEILDKELTVLLSLSSKEVAFQKIQQRLTTQKDGLIRALLLTPDGTNNLAERELRPLVINRKMSYGSDTFSGMETTAVIASVVQTIKRQKETDFLPTLRNYLSEGLQKTYPRYLQIAFEDT